MQDQHGSFPTRSGMEPCSRHGYLHGLERPGIFLGLLEDDTAVLGSSVLIHYDGSIRDYLEMSVLLPYWIKGQPYLCLVRVCP
ncbi:hypothetical protein DPMN_106926 [Dreissena polymorpha]|uniref:Uncharacterized protein n=1 Tax=Dreissena polymorpha TaxID=45954 RepID=A0A9D4K643_DREPO|nr:hypothetical protein DPMN_106926 [Dreissena polymorpha]